MNKAKMIYIIIGVIVVAGILIAVAKLRSGSNGVNDQQSQSNQNQQSQQASNQPTPTPFTGCPNGTNITQTDSNGRFEPTIDISNKVAVLNTTDGLIKIALYDKDAPKTVENFVCLIQKGYYNGISFHRVSHGFVIQAGDPTGTGSGGESVFGPTFEDELYQDTPSYKTGYVKGVLAMANRGPNTNSSQFFILLADHPELPKNYTIFGKVTSGMDVVQKLGATPVTPVMGPEDGTPTTPIKINSATIENSK